MEDPMREMRARFERLSHESPEQRDALRSLKLLAAAGVLPFTRERLGGVMHGVFERYPAHLGDCLDGLREQSFLISDTQISTSIDGQELVWPEPAYLTYAVSYLAGKSPVNDLPRLAEVLKNLKDYEGLFYLGNSYIEQERYEEAIESYDAALRIKPDLANALAFKGLALYGLERYEECIEASDHALDLMSDSSDIQLIKAMTWHCKSSALTQIGRHQEALDAIVIALRLSPHDPDVWDTKSLILLNLSHYEQALEVSDKVLYLAPDYAEAFQHKGLGLAGLGRYEEALKWLRRAWDAREQLSDQGAEVKEVLIKLGHDLEEGG